MKIMQVNSFYYNRGGDCTHMFATGKMLEKYGHTVVYFSMQHPLNFASPYSKYWPTHIDYKEALRVKNLLTISRVLLRTVYSFEAKKRIAAMLDAEKPDVVHLHNILHHITPSILGEIRKKRIPIVWTLHDYTIICPNTFFLSDRNGVICEACKSGRFYMAPIKRCKKNSLGASLVAMTENYIHRILCIYRYVDLFLSPSEFLRKKFEEHGMGNRIITLNNFIDINAVMPTYSHKNYAIYAGRLTNIKGVGTLIKVAASISGLKIKIVGDGELKGVLSRQAGGNVEFLGLKSKAAVQELIAGAMFVFVPSECYENFPYAVLEPMAQGKSVIGARIGGIPELIEDGVTGILFKSGDYEDLREKTLYMLRNKDAMVKMGEQARKCVEEHFSEKNHYEQLIGHYQRLIKRYAH